MVGVFELFLQLLLWWWRLWCWWLLCGEDEGVTDLYVVTVYGMKRQRYIL